MIKHPDFETGNRSPVPGDRIPAARYQQPTSSSQYPVSSIHHPVFGNRRPLKAWQKLSTRNTQHATLNTRRDFGFTLLEVLIALAIMAIVLAGVYRMHLQTLSMETANRFYTQAPLLAQSKMAQLEASSSDVVSGDSGDFGEKFPGYSWSVSTEDISADALGEDAEDLKRIDVTVSLNEDEYVYTVRSYLLMVK